MEFQMTAAQNRTLSAIRGTLTSFSTIVEDSKIITTRRGWKVLLVNFTTNDGTTYQYKISPFGGVLKMQMTTLDSISATHDAGKVSINVEIDDVETSIEFEYNDFMEQVNARMDLENWNDAEVVYNDYILSIDDFLQYHIDSDVLIDIFSHNKQ